MTTTNNNNNNNKVDDADPSPPLDNTLAVIRRLTRPLINPPSVEELDKILTRPWPMKVCVSPTDYTTLNHWKDQKHTELFEQMLDWPTEGESNNESNKPTTHLHPYFSFGDSSQASFFFHPWQDVGNCLRNLLLHQIASHQTLNHDLTLSSHDVDLFVATGPKFPEQEITCIETTKFRISSQFYLLRCHYDDTNQTLMFGYHTLTKSHKRHHDDDDDDDDDVQSTSSSTSIISKFQQLHVISIKEDDNWRLQTCIILRNLACIIGCLKDYAIPLTTRTDKLSIVMKSNKKKQQQQQQRNNNNDDHMDVKKQQLTTKPFTSPSKMMIQKCYENDQICNVYNATVTNMIYIYEIMKQNHVPHVDTIVSVVDDTDNEKGSNNSTCLFAPIGRSYLPENFNELLDALICVSETLVALKDLNIMHRDIRWANVFHAFKDEYQTITNDDNDNNNYPFTREWILFDFEFAASVPQDAFPAHTLTPENHAPEMISHDVNDNEQQQQRQQSHNDDKQEEKEKEIVGQQHTTAVDIWGLGYLIQHAEVDIPLSHFEEMKQLQNDCLQKNPNDRPTAKECLTRLKDLQAKPQSKEKDLS